jgi:predicted nuclease of predicted toxin-antitoxin system
VKFKLDENVSRAAAALLREAKFDVVTVSDQELEGARDPDLIGCCVREERCLITMDAEFGNPLLYPPRHYRGIVLLRLPGRATTELIRETVRTLRDALLASGSPAGSSIPLPGPDRHLWVVQPGRVRLYQGEDE